MLGRHLDTLVNCDLLPNLCPPPDPDLFPEGIKTGWVTPGLAVWDYVDRDYAGDLSGDRIERMKAFSRMAGEIGAKYHILEGFAYRWSDEVISEFVGYSQSHGVRTLFWRHSRDLRTPESREEFFSRLARLGVAGAKIDFFDHEAKEVIDLYETLLEAAARHRMVVNFHGANKPTGRMRTWPNELVREAVRGMESSRLRDRARHQTVLPFTRYLAGPADYTTMVFNERRGDSSWAHQIASLITFDSPLLTIAAHPQSVLDSSALELIKSIQPVWDETVVLPQSRIGDLSVFARRSGQMWMLAAMSTGPARSLDLPLGFLGGGEYDAVLVADDPERDAALTTTHRTARSSDALTVHLRPGGGFAARFTSR
jgi:alpha-glucosidase